VVDRVGDQIVLVGPAAVQGRLAGVRAGGNPLHRQAAVAEGPQQVEDSVEDRLLECDAAPAVGVRPARRLGRVRERNWCNRHAVRLSGHRSTSPFSVPVSVEQHLRTALGTT